jgi:carboxylesterase
MNTALHNPHLDGSPFFWEAGPVGIVLSHGLTATVAEVRPLATILHRHGFTVAGPLLPGHNTRPEDLNRTTWQDWLGAVEDAYQKVAAHCDRVFVGGESTGALASILTAVRHPEILGVLTYAPAIKLVLSALDTLKLYVAAPFIPSVAKGSLDVSHAWQGYPVNPLKAAIQLLDMQAEVVRQLPRLQQPILVFMGRQDTTVDHSAPDIIAKNAGSMIKEIHWMEKSSHVIIIDQELEQVSAITLQFIQKILEHKHEVS